MTRQTKTLTALLLASAVLPTAAFADSGLYFGASIGSSHLDEDFTGITLDTDATAYRIVAGVQLGDYLGIEGGYHDFGDFTETLDVGGLLTDTEIGAEGWTLGATLGLPVSDQFSLFGRAGVFFWDAEVEVNGFSIDVPEDENPYYGGGAKFDVSPNFSLIGDWTRYELDDVDSDVISIGFQYRFGR